MERIGSHQHFWKYHPVNHAWMNDDMGILKTDYTAGDIEPLLSACQLDGCVAVQASQTEAENDFLLHAAAGSSIIKGIVGWTDLQAENVAERLMYYKQFKKIKGFRRLIHDDADVDFMLRPAFLNGIKALKDFGFTYDVLIFPGHHANTFELVSKTPDSLLLLTI